MANLESISIKGLRSIVDSGVISLKPINILVGNNSSGKSSFLRTFPLIRQSVEQRTRGPVLWNGLFTDFESFDNSVHNSPLSLKDDDNNFIEFEFEFDWQNPSKVYDKSEFKCRASIRIAAGKSKFTSYTSVYTLEIDEHEITLKFDESGRLLDISSPQVSWDLSKIDFKYQQSETDSLLPFLSAGLGKTLLHNNSRDLTHRLFGQIKDILRELSGRRSEARLIDLAYKVISLRGNINERVEKFLNLQVTEKWKKLEVDNSDLIFIAALSDLLFLIQNSELINRRLSKIFKGVRYIAPLRTSTERYYRFQDLSIEEIDHQGANLAMFLTAVPKRWREKLDEWTSENFSFLISEKYEGSNISIEISYKNHSQSDNITDMGFGFSQLLPIIVNLWSVSSGYENYRKRKVDQNDSIIFAIEQPELHLHPKMQSKMALIFSKAISLAKENSIKLILIIETHSEALISKFGDMICLEEEDAKNVSVRLFEQDRQTRNTKIREAFFNEKGVLNNWPTDFFAY
ncbi:AAA family ATPase [uncultured Pseudoalteromonas sp.]|uniref:AAA family ATPase n=1 Tax=uncultured Pseudoalteromonas sp. TaxID=114053 RepID=UPI002631D800|nr:AAA family ATPase [uncultured Pseudoalteromonas sp.]